MINTIYNTPLSVFIACYCDADYSSLGAGEKGKEAWGTLFQEYLQESGGTLEDEAYLLEVESTNLWLNIFCYRELLEILKQYAHSDGIEFFRKEGFKLDYDPENQDEYLNQLKKIEGRFKAWELDHMDKMVQLQQIKSRPNTTKVDRGYFDRSLAALSKYSGYHVDETATTISRYIAINKTLQEEARRAEQHVGRR
ncbi:hypothetical protein [Chitinophaga sp. sic0106]|uniref:hypothetical protein n=1 Tax=Chitinophaga sp. sic0106 TaxID=2854785 RepID=UPI001C4428BA|nr:hypothetical protein [Chitinophaga sp. sic0106]MBV7531346.1 hypothetical protein [Chitinophaga sp. sic0106]